MRRQRSLPARKSADVPKIYLHESIVWPHLSPSNRSGRVKIHMFSTPKMSQTQLAAKLKSDQCILAQVKSYSYVPNADFSYDWRLRVFL